MYQYNDVLMYQSGNAVNIGKLLNWYIVTLD